MSREGAVVGLGLMIVVLCATVLGGGAQSAAAATLFEDNFDSNPCGSWAIYYDDWSDAGCTVYYETGSQDACGTTWGYAYREYEGNRWMVSPAFTTAGYTNVKLTFHYKNDSGASLEAWVLQDGIWVHVASVGQASSWAGSQTDLTGTITGVMFHFVGGNGESRRLDCVSITGDPGGGPTTLFEDNFDNDPYANGWTGVGRYWNSSQDACGSTWGYAYRDGTGSFVSPTFSTAGYTDLKLIFWHKNDTGGGYKAEVLEGGTWYERAHVTTPNVWTRNEVAIGAGGTATQIRFTYDGCGQECTQRVDCVSVVSDPGCSPPVEITQHPADLGVCVGQTAIFMVTASGSSLTYQWQQDQVDLSDGGDVSGATSDTLQIANAEPADNGQYRCVVTGDCGTATSNAATLTVGSQPTITQQPQPCDVCVGSTVTFTLSAVGAGTLTYQWQKDGGNLSDGGDISGATTHTLQIANAEASDEGDYRCVVTDDCGTTPSEEAALTVTTECGLAVSPGGHYITYNGQTLMLIGDSGTQCAAQNSNLDHREWIDDCYDRGIRAVHVWAFIAARQKQDGSVIEDRWGYVYPDITPWARHTSGPLAKDQKYQWNLQAWDEGSEGDFTHYWPRMRDMASYAKSKDMVLGVTVFTGWAKPGQEPWEYHPFKTDNGGHLSSASDAVIIESPGTEVWQQTWSGSWSNAKKTQWLWEQLCIKLIDDLGSIGNVFFVFFDEHSYSDGNMENHFRDFFRNRGQIWMDQNAMRSSVDLVMSSTFGGDDKNADAVSGFTGSPARPYFFLEGHPYMGDGVRTAIWTFSVGGGNYFFHGDYDQETVTTGIMGYDPYVPGGDKGMYKRDWLGDASRLFNEHIVDLDSMAPHNELCDSGAYCLADPGREYVVYSSSGSSFNVDLSAGAGETFACRFYDPSNGNFQSTFQRTGGGVEAFTKPDSSDWALHMVTGDPVSVIDADPTSGAAPLAVNFDGSGSYDPGGTIVSYEWDFENDGTPDANGVTTSHVYTQYGPYTAKLTVTDDEDNTASTTVPISVICEVTVTNLNRYATTNYSTGSLIYSDRDYTITSMPSALEGVLGIRTANDDKNETSETWITFDVDIETDVYIAYDVRATALPNWMSGYVDTGEVIGVSDWMQGTAVLYAKTVPAGSHVVLGGNMAAGAAGAASNYFVLLVGSCPVTLRTLTLTETNGPWGDVQIAPEPNDANNIQFPEGTAVTLTAQPIEGKAFRQWEIYDPNYPDDVNHAVIDANLSTTIFMDTDMHVNAAFKCGSGVWLLLPMVVAAIPLFLLIRQRTQARRAAAR